MAARSTVGIVYVRYADDFVIGIQGSLKNAIVIKNNLGKFLSHELKLALREEKTAVTKFSTGFNFLGHTIINGANKFLKDKNGLKMNLADYTFIYVNMDKVLSNLVAEGYLK